MHVKGEPVDPLGIEPVAGDTLTGAALVAFPGSATRIDVSRAGQSG